VHKIVKQERYLVEGRIFTPHTANNTFLCRFNKYKLTSNMQTCLITEIGYYVSMKRKFITVMVNNFTITTKKVTISHPNSYDFRNPGPCFDTGKKM